MKPRFLAALGMAALMLSAAAGASPGPARATPASAAAAAAKLRPALQRALDAAVTTGRPLPVWVYFRDKDLAPGEDMSRALDEARSELRARSLSRRAKTRPAGGLVDELDLPVAPAYTAQAAALSAGVRAESRWLNAISVEAAPAQIAALARLDFVAALDLVRGFERDDPPMLDAMTEEEGPAGAPDPNPGLKAFYGAAYRQVAMMGVPEMHAAGLTGRGVLVCLLDLGFHKAHEALRTARIVAERDFVMKDGDVQQDPLVAADYTDYHGTACWSLLGGYMPGTMVGPAYGADFILGKTEDYRSEKPVEEDYWVAGIEWAESLGADVVSSSLGYTEWYRFADMDGRTAVTTRAANRATELGVVVVNAAGNDRTTSWGHIIAPSDGFDVLAVGAVDANRRISTFSSPGPTADGRIKPEICAMGVRCFVARSGPGVGDSAYAQGNGTSYATPLAAGVVALLLEAHPEWTVAQVREALMATAGNADAPNNDYGWGVVNGPAALRR